MQEWQFLHTTAVAKETIYLSSCFVDFIDCLDGVEMINALIMINQLSPIKRIVNLET